MNLDIRKTELRTILPFRAQFLQENNFQIRYDACHVRNWSDSYLLELDGRAIGYGSVKGKEELSDRDTVFEFYLIPTYRKWTSPVFVELLRTTRVAYVTCQSNDLLLTSLLYEFCKKIYSDVVLFSDQVATDHTFPDLIFRKRQADDFIFGKKQNEAGDYVLERSGEVVAIGGFLTHYNPPFADLFMEVKSDCRKQGLGSFLLQEIKKECYRAGRVPAARCNMDNKASRATLIKAGFRVCGFMLHGTLSKR